MNAKVILVRLLLAFVLVSVGFVLGRETAPRRPQAAAAPPTTSPATAANKVLVYYLHRTVRCMTCNGIERATRQVLASDFAQPLREGRLEFQVENFQENETLAQRYEVATSSVVLVRFQDGREVEHRRLDDVWRLAHEPVALSAYIHGAVDEYLQGASR